MPHPSFAWVGVFCGRPFRLARQRFLHGSISVIERCQINAVPRSDCFNLLDSFRSDEPSSLRERFEPSLQSKSHAFKQASMHHIGEGMPIQNSMEIRREAQSACDLSQPAEKDFGV